MSRDILWEDIFRSNAWGRYPPEDLIRFCAQRFYALQPRSSVNLLEVGFGTGANLWYLAREGFNVHGMEGSEAGAAQARRRLDAELPGWDQGDVDRLRVGDMCDPLPWPDNHFDAVIDNDAVTCVDHASACRVYAEMHRVARSGSWLYARTPAAGTWGAGTGQAHGYNSWRCSEGPFAGTGIVRFASEADLADLFKPWKLLQVEQLTRTMENRSRIHTEWIVIARKDES